MRRPSRSLASPTQAPSTCRRPLMPSSLLVTLTVLLVSLMSRAGAQAAEPAKPVIKKQKADFNRDVRPILAKNCFACHGQDETKRGKGLRLDQRDAALAKRKEADPAIIPGDPDSSPLILRVTEDDDSTRMPPKTAGNPLTRSEIDTLTRWIAQGAGYETHWSLVPPQTHPLPAVKNQTWPRTPIDTWILAKLEEEGLTPSPEADRYTLLRRASLDLRGLPPSPHEIDRFLNDPSSDAFEKAVDRLLEDPAYGERMARTWLDLARYADSAGYGSDPLRPNIWRYRDWVIAAFNKNIPYDRFTIQQIAGDLLPNATLEDRMATAFHRNTMTNTEGGTDDEEWRVAAIKDRVDTTGQVWMGLTIGCAKCHSHKFDPITQHEYYQFYAFFDQTADHDQPDESPVIPAPTPELTAQLASIEAQITPLRAKLEAAKKSKLETEIQAIDKQIAALEKSKPKLPTLPVMVELPPDKRRTTHLLRKGNFIDPGDVVTPGVPRSLHAMPQEAPRNRLGLAYWLVDPKNPLTARVAVNRYWAQLFGSGLVEADEDFGTQGESPTHPELLDWLAVHYRNTGWDTKAILRLMVTSAVYRQSSRVTPALLEKDPRNRLLARAPRVRLEAEMVRDQALALAGLLDRKVGGPSVFPPQPPGLWQAAFNGERTWTTSTGSDRHRRGIYTFWRRTVPYPSMAAFDAPSREICTIRRVRTNTPLQSFVTLNDPVYVEAAQSLARRIVREGGQTPESRAKFGLKLCLGRPPKPEQLTPLVSLAKTELTRFRSDPAAATALATEPLGPLPPGMDPAELAAWTAVANVLLNLDAVLTKG